MATEVSFTQFISTLGSGLTSMQAKLASTIDALGTSTPSIAQMMDMQQQSSQMNVLAETEGAMIKQFSDTLKGVAQKI